jgi:chorismate synthase
MNNFGRLFRTTVFGESHGEAIGVILDGVPAGIALSTEDFDADIARRKPGAAGTTPRIEADAPQILSGVFGGKTTGAPLCIRFLNGNTQSKDYSAFQNQPRPGHADFVAATKYKGFNDYRGGGHFSGRLTLLLVAAGVVAKKILPQGVHIQANLLQIGGQSDINLGLQRALDANDSIGGVVECRATGLPIGWGEPFFDSIESVLAHLLFAIPAVKGVEFGSGFAAATMFGSTHNDPILDAQGTTATNNAGGIVGGISNGNPLVVRIAIKPTSSTPQPQQTYNYTQNAVSDFRAEGRHDLCIALRVPVVMEAVVAMGLADFHLLHKANW